MSRDNPLSKQHLFYLGEISEPPQWLSAAARSTVAPILDSSRVGLFCLENPSAEQAGRLENMAADSGGVVSVLNAGGADLHVYVGPVRPAPNEKLPGAGQSEPTHESLDFGDAVERYSARRFTLKLRGGPLSLGGRTKIMGVLNVTPDSFSDAGRFHALDAAIAHAEKMIEDGADIIDVGGESTRPGSDPVPIEEEAGRVLPVIEYLARNASIPISIDTCKAEIARRAIDAGADIINDVSALSSDPRMMDVAKESGCPIVLMHMRLTPKDMQRDPHYDALLPEIISFLQGRIEICVEGGIDPEQILVDPGIGFGKTVGHNLEIIRELDRFRALGRPILIGTSRKSTIGAVLDADVDDRIEGTAATVALAIEKGAHIVRVHDVREMARVAKMTDAVMGREWK